MNFESNEIELEHPIDVLTEYLKVLEYTWAEFVNNSCQLSPYVDDPIAKIIFLRNTLLYMADKGVFRTHYKLIYEQQIDVIFRNRIQEKTDDLQELVDNEVRMYDAVLEVWKASHRGTTRLSRLGDIAPEYQES